jgi:RES domain
MGGDVSATMLDNPPEPDKLRSLGIHADESRVIGVDEVWWRVHRTVGRNVLPWNAFRTYGPKLRFDPHVVHAGPKPAGDDPAHGVWYGASTPDAALAEAFQVGRTISRALDTPYLTGLSFSRPVVVLDLAFDSAGLWATRVGGTFGLSTEPHQVTQRWARAIVEAFPDLDGLRYSSRFANAPCLALFLPAATAMPAHPKMSQPLTHPDLTERITGAAYRLGYRVV